MVRCEIGYYTPPYSLNDRSDKLTNNNDGKPQDGNPPHSSDTLVVEPGETIESVLRTKMKIPY